MPIIGYALVMLGFLVATIGETMFTVATYRRGLFWFFGCLFIPFFSFFFLILNLKSTIKPFLLSTLGAAIVVWIALYTASKTNAPSSSGRM